MFYHFHRNIYLSALFVITTVYLQSFAHAQPLDHGTNLPSSNPSSSQPSSTTKSSSQPSSTTKKVEVDDVDHCFLSGIGQESCEKNALVDFTKFSPDGKHVDYDEENYQNSFNKKGRWSIGGTLFADIHYDGNTSANFVLNPFIGHFISDGLEIGFSLSGIIGVGDFYEETIAGGIGVETKLRYISNTNGIVPFVGVALGPTFFSLSKNVRSWIALKILLGLLIEINRNVYLNLGISPTFSFGLGKNWGEVMFDIPIGILGIEAFF